jgi:hypothetical protein
VGGGSKRRKETRTCFERPLARRASEFWGGDHIQQLARTCLCGRAALLGRLQMPAGGGVAFARRCAAATARCHRERLDSCPSRGLQRCAATALSRLRQAASRSQSVAGVTGRRRTPAAWPSSSRSAACASVSPASKTLSHLLLGTARQPANQGAPRRGLAQCIAAFFETASQIRAPHATLLGKPPPARWSWAMPWLDEASLC